MNKNVIDFMRPNGMSDDDPIKAFQTEALENQIRLGETFNHPFIPFWSENVSFFKKQKNIYMNFFGCNNS